MKNLFRDKLIHWYQTRPIREQWLLAVGSLAILAWLFWFGIAQPLAQENQLAQSRVASAQQTLLEVRELSQQLMAVRSEQPGSAGHRNTGLAQWVYSTAEQNQVALATLDLSADGMSASLRSEALPLQDALAWLYDMEAESLASVDNVTITPASDTGTETTVVAALNLRWR